MSLIEVVNRGRAVPTLQRVEMMTALSQCPRDPIGANLVAETNSRDQKILVRASKTTTDLLLRPQAKLQFVWATCHELARMSCPVCPASTGSLAKPAIHMHCHFQAEFFSAHWLKKRIATQKLCSRKSQNI